MTEASKRDYQILQLGERIDVVPLLAAWHHAEWSHYNPGDTVARRIERLRRHAQPGRIPTTFVAVAGPDLLGSASLVAADMHDRSHLSPWLASVYVHPPYRRRGIGQALVKRVVAEARALGVPRLYLFTPDQEEWYAGMGWHVTERRLYMGKPAVIMTLELREEGS
jgi:GNAT superfamily N-acetyltransferase